jgi:hypothetical protein
MLRTLFNAPAIYGRLRLRNLAGLPVWQMKKTIELEVPLFLLVAVQQGELHPTALKSIISRVRALKTPRPSAQQWFEAMRFCLSTEQK